MVQQTPPLVGPNDVIRIRREGRCLTETEMLARGMLVNARGYWVSSEFTRDVA